MRRVIFRPPVDNEAWREWQQSAARHQTVIGNLYRRFRAGEESAFTPDIEEDLYKGSRPFVMPFFNGFCAYCESALTPVVGQGDVEHYRPKKRVEAFKYKPRPNFDALEERLKTFVDVPAVDYGYFWLAYDPENLVPACPLCNRTHKRSFFPVRGVQKGRGAPRRLAYAENPRNKSEEPMLLHPFFDDPNEHLSFADERGFVAPLSLRGAVSIAVLGLNREGLPEARRDAAEGAQRIYTRYIQAKLDRDAAKVANHDALLDRYEQGRSAYSTAALTAIGILEEEIFSDRAAAKNRARGIWPSELKDTFAAP